VKHPRANSSQSTARETVELTIHDVAYGGRGVARLDGLVYFVDGALTGEVVRADITRRKRKCVETELREVVSASPHRIPAACCLSRACPGCSYQHAAYDAEVDFKHKQLKDLLARIGGCGEIVCADPVPSPAVLHYRNKLTLHVKHDALGYYGKDNTTILDVEHCPLAVNAINGLLPAAREQVSSFNHGASVVFRWTPQDGAMYWGGRDKPPKSRLTENTPFGDVLVPAGSFFQANSSAFDALIGVVSDKLGSIAAKTVIDTYCGVGIFAFAASRTGVSAVLGIDADTRAIRAARSNARELGFADTDFIAGTAESLLSEALEAVKPGETAVILDPPRAGVEAAALETLIHHRPSDIVYVSCAADTMARDVKKLRGAGYSPVDTRMVDMFPRTALFESITHLHSDR
jgi:tRNA/tmRNA/rRNA uracil-C5-methylase (TrmA/RlmC/RlmD family)